MTDRETRDDQAQRDQALAQGYRKAEAGEAHHERKSSGPGHAGYDPTLGVTNEVPDVPLTDAPHPDKADGENYAAPPSDKGPAYDRLMRGLEPGETSADG